MIDYEALRARPLKASYSCKFCCELWDETYEAGVYLKQKKIGVHVRDHHCGQMGHACRWTRCPKCGRTMTVVLQSFTILSEEGVSVVPWSTRKPRPVPLAS